MWPIILLCKQINAVHKPITHSVVISYACTWSKKSVHLGLKISVTTHASTVYREHWLKATTTNTIKIIKVLHERKKKKENNESTI